VRIIVSYTEKYVRQLSEPKFEFFFVYTKALHYAEVSNLTEKERFQIRSKLQEVNKAQNEFEKNHRGSAPEETTEWVTMSGEDEVRARLRSSLVSVNIP